MVGSVGGRGEYLVQDVLHRHRTDLNLASRAPHTKKNKLAGCLCDCFLVTYIILNLILILISSYTTEYFQTVINGFLLPCLVLVGPAFLLFLLYNCYNQKNLTVLDVLYHYFPFLQTSLNALNETYNNTKHSIEKLDLLKGRDH